MKKKKYKKRFWKQVQENSILKGQYEELREDMKILIMKPEDEIFNQIIRKWRTRFIVETAPTKEFSDFKLMAEKFLVGSQEMRDNEFKLEFKNEASYREDYLQELNSTRAREKKIDEITQQWNGPKGIYPEMLILKRPTFETQQKDFVNIVNSAAISTVQFNPVHIHCIEELCTLYLYEMNLFSDQFDLLNHRVIFHPVPEFNIGTKCFPDPFASFLFVIDEKMNPETGILIKVVK